MIDVIKIAKKNEAVRTYTLKYNRKKGMECALFNIHIRDG